jgi:lactate dehydrogenase-like 2-hydroxyacid dehydrogenase
LVSYAKSHDNLIITPHYGGATVDARLKTETKTIDLISEALTHINN